jgi:hypothetical protein
MIINLEHAPPNSPVHLIWGGIALATIAAAGVMKSYLNLLPPCIFREATGLPCLTCGGTRCIAELSSFHIAKAFLFNPLIMVFTLAIIVFSFLVGLGLILKRRLVIKLNKREARLMRLLAVVLVAANWVYLIIYLR